MSDQEPVFVPYQELSPEALRGVMESFVLREGTEYGAQDFTLDQKLAHKDPDYPINTSEIP